MKIKIILLSDIRQTKKLTARLLFLTIIKAACTTLSFEKARKMIEESIVFFPSDETSKQQLREEVFADLRRIGATNICLSEWWKHIDVERTRGGKRRGELVREIRLAKMIELAYYVYKDEKLSHLINKHEFELDFRWVLNHVREDEIRVM